MANKNVCEQIYISRKNVLQLMGYQGYNTEEYNYFSINEVDSMKMNNQLDMLVHSKTDKKVYIRYYLDRLLRPQQLHEMIDDLFVLSETLQKKDTLYIITNDLPNDSLTAEIKHIWERDKVFVVIESIKCLQYNILNHTLVPPHRILNDNACQELFEKYKITNPIQQLPNISRFDPVARAICLRPEQICHIIRPSKTAINSDYYRVCI